MIRTPYLVLFIFLGAIAIGTASALITITLAGDVAIEGDLDMTDGKISNLVTPTDTADAATKGYVDSVPETDTLSLLDCTTDQIARWTGTEWTCSSINSSSEHIFVGGRQSLLPLLFMVIPSPFGEDAFSNPRYMGVWGINLVNPTEVDVTVSKVTIVVYPSTGNDNDTIIPIGGAGCDMNMIQPTADWSCPKENTILWQNSVTPVSLPARSAVEFLVAVEPGAAAGGRNIDALIVQANVFTNLGPFGNLESYQSSMRSDDTSIVNVFLTSTDENRFDFHGVQDDMGIVEKVTSNFRVSLADMDDEDTTFIEDGAQLIINITRKWTVDPDNGIISSVGFENCTICSPDDRIIVHGDGSTQILLKTAVSIGGPTGGDKDVLTVSFDATPPCNEITGEKRPYIMRVHANGMTSPDFEPFPIGPLNEIGLVVEPEPVELNCP